jgi:hypothetical protein
MQSFLRWLTLTALVVLLLGASAADVLLGSVGLNATERGFARREGAVRGPGTSASHVHVVLPERADGETEIGQGPGMHLGTRWRLEGAHPSQVEVDGGRAIYHDVLPSTALLWTAAERRAELFLLLRDDAAPASFQFHVSLGAALVKGEAETSGGIAFSDAAGRKRLRVGAAFAVDAKGIRREASLSWSRGTIGLSVDTRGLTYPVLVDPPIETVEWSLAVPQSSPLQRYGHAMVYDSARRRTVVFGGAGNVAGLADTWEWDGATWMQQTPATSPSARNGHAMAYDSVRDRIVLFGGVNSQYLSDTWEWDGTNWTQQAPAAVPSGRTGHTMAYDSTRGKTVLFGGGDGTQEFSDTWEWDGTNWTQQTPATSPSARLFHAMAFDSGRGRTVLFSGDDLPDTWEWDGTNWTQQAPATSPPGRYYHVMAYDSARGQTVLFSGGNASNNFTDTWEWDGANWTERAPASGPQSLRQAAMVYDVARGETVLFGGETIPPPYDTLETWAWDGSSWTERTPTTSPPPREGHAMAYDSARSLSVLFGGADGPWHTMLDTGEWDGAIWMPRAPATSPGARAGHAMAYDVVRGKTVLFGGADRFYDDDLGFDSAYYYSDTWEWDGANWTQRAPATSPPARAGHAMAYDSVHGKIVLFGGVFFPAVPFGTQQPAYFADTWEWDGTTWTQRAPPVSPPFLYGHAVAYDSARGRTVLVGAAGTWEWDGTTWTQPAPTTSPAAHAGHAMAHDVARGKTVLYGGGAQQAGGGGFFEDTSEWDGTTWAQQAPATNPGPSWGHTMVYDGARGNVVLFGGLNANLLGDTWVYAAYGGACTANAECDSGSCVGGVCSPPCMAQDECHSAGTWLPKSSACSYPVKPNGAPCNDGNACTAGDTCQAGVCTAGSPVTCMASDPCHEAGSCDPTSGGCTNPAMPDGTPCAAGTCQSGVCTGSVSSSSSSGAGGAATSTSSGSGGGAASTSSGLSGLGGSDGGRISSAGGSSTGNNAGATLTGGAECACHAVGSSGERGGLAAMAVALGWVMTRPRSGGRRNRRSLSRSGLAGAHAPHSAAPRSGGRTRR